MKTKFILITLLASVISFVSCGGDDEGKTNPENINNKTEQSEKKNRSVLDWKNVEGDILYLNMKVYNSKKEWVNKGENMCYTDGNLYWNDKADGNSVMKVSYNPESPDIITFENGQTMQITLISENELQTKGPDALTRSWKYSPIE